MHIPVVNRIAPELTGRGIIIGRNPRNAIGLQLLIHLEQGRVCPYITAVRRNIDRNIADDGNTLFIGISAQLVPLVKEQVLHKDIEINAVLQLKRIAAHCLRIAALDVLVIPIPKRLLVKMLFQGHKHGVIVNPAAVVHGKRCRLAQLLDGCRLERLI